MKVTNIVWDTDGEKTDLPTTVGIEENIDAENAADYLSDKYGFCIVSLDVEEDIDLGTFSVDVKLQSDGKFDVYIAHEGSSGEHYANITADRIGELVAGDIECLAEGYQQEFYGSEKNA